MQTRREELAAAIADVRGRGDGIFMPFVVIGDPSPEASMQLALTLCDNGADIIEFGFPFSDPPADGPVIQAADDRALRAGVTPAMCLQFIADLRAQRGTPVALLIYYNLILQHGVDRFYEQAASAGVNAVLVADVPVEHAKPLLTASEEHGIAQVFIASELSSDERLQRLAAAGSGYVYTVARIGITGEQSEVSSGLANTLQRARAATNLPLFVGFGISAPEHVRAVMDAGADGAICGSAIVRIIEPLARGEKSLEETAAALAAFSAEMKAATVSEAGAANKK